jgi:hypothetical protein
MNAHNCTDSRGLDEQRLDEQRPAATGYVPAIVDAALARFDDAHYRAAALPTDTDAQHAVRARRLAVVAEMRARWWRVLRRWVYSEAGQPLPLLFGAAAMLAARSAEDDARFWREAAQDWQARADRRPTSDAAGALSNHHELEIAS